MNIYRNKFILSINLLIIFSILLPQVSLAQEKEKYHIKKVVIDAGHGGKDPGAVGKKMYEKDIALKIALKLGAYIEEYIKDVEVIYTRKTDVFIPLDERARIANDAKADLFISIHVNSTLNKKIYGTSTYVMGLNKSEDNLEVAKLENSVIVYESNYESKYSGYDPNSPESYIILNLYQDAFQEHSLLLATKIEKQFSKRAGRRSLGVRQDGFVVLWMTTMPSVLVETGFLSNLNEELFLITDYGQSIIASAIFRAFRDYKNHIESKTNFWHKSYNSVYDKFNIIQKLPEKNKRTDKKVIQNPIQKTNEISFRVQIKSSEISISLDDPTFKGIKGIEELNIDGMYKYVVGKTDNYIKIVELQTRIRKKIPDAFVVAYKNNKRIDIEEALNVYE